MITTTNPQPYTPSFSARCKQVRDADWVCHILNQTLPHSSVTKHQIRIINFVKKNKKLLDFANDPNNLSEAYEILKRTQKTPQNKSIIKKIYILRDMLDYFGERRQRASTLMENELFHSLYCLEKFKIGNCCENATIAELILKMNGVHNATCASIYKGKISDKSPHNWSCLDHVICVFNKDGSPFRGDITKHTIFIDPWLNKAGFAKDMERLYKYEFAKLFKLKTKECFKYKEKEKVFLSKKQMKILKKQYHAFIFKNKNHDFMQNNKKSIYSKIIDYLLNK